MTLLLIGLLLFLGMHSTRIFAEDFRTRQIARLGERTWKGVYAVASLVGFVLMVWGYGLARQEPVVLWASPVWLRHVAALLTWFAFVMLTAAYVPGNHLKALLQHPMTLAVKVWAFAHLIANNTLADLLLFGAFLAWAVLSYRAAKARDRDAGTRYAPGTLPRTLITIVVGTAAWIFFVVWAHAAWIGVRPLG